MNRSILAISLSHNYACSPVFSHSRSILSISGFGFFKQLSPVVFSSFGVNLKISDGYFSKILNNCIYIESNDISSPIYETNPVEMVFMKARFENCFASNRPGAAICANNADLTLNLTYSVFVDCKTTGSYSFGGRNSYIGAGAVAFSGKYLFIECIAFDKCNGQYYGGALYTYTAPTNEQYLSNIACTNCGNDYSYSIPMLIDIGKVYTSYINNTYCYGMGAAFHFGLYPNVEKCDYCVQTNNNGQYLFWVSTVSQSQINYVNIFNNTAVHYIFVHQTFTFNQFIIQYNTGSIAIDSGSSLTITNTVSDTSLTGAILGSGCIITQYTQTHLIVVMEKCNKLPTLTQKYSYRPLLLLTAFFSY